MLYLTLYSNCLSQEILISRITEIIVLLCYYNYYNIIVLPNTWMYVQMTWVRLTQLKSCFAVILCKGFIDHTYVAEKFGMLYDCGRLVKSKKTKTIMLLL